MPNSHITTQVYLAFKEANVLLEWNWDVYMEKAIEVSKEFDPEAFLTMVRKYVARKAHVKVKTPPGTS